MSASNRLQECAGFSHRYPSVGTTHGVKVQMVTVDADSLDDYFDGDLNVPGIYIEK
ncbi:MAG TPA: hypothetical protein QGF35_07865 [Dehalococcoidia bacterium]|jgi:hypothetical protein|nr:hypothetical protein [Dehalococcoidia bacterium]